MESLTHSPLPYKKWFLDHLSSDKSLPLPSTSAYILPSNIIHTYIYIICNFFFSDKLRKFSISDFPKQTHFGHILITLFFFSPFNRSTLWQQPELVQPAQNILVKCGLIRGCRKKIKWSICALNVSAWENHLCWIFWVCPRKKNYI